MSSLAQGIISMTSYALTLVANPDACPVEQLVSLRRQAESIAKQVYEYHLLSLSPISSIL